MTVDWIGAAQLLANLQRYTGIPFEGVPVWGMVRVPAHLGNLRQLRFEFLQAYHVGSLLVQPLLELGSPSPDAVDVPGGDFHVRKIIHRVVHRPTRLARRW